MSQISKTKPGKSSDRKPSFDKGAFYRTCRMLHGYLSAFAFAAMIFFCFTGLLLDHPEWFNGANGKASTLKLTLSKPEISQALSRPDPSRELGSLVSEKAPLKGAFASGDIEGQKALLRFEGPKGTSDIDLDLQSGAVTADVVKSPIMLFIQDLHRGKNSGGPWRFIIDLSAYVGLAMSIIGYILFFSLRFRLRTSLTLTAVSLVGMAGVGLLLVQ